MGPALFKNEFMFLYLEVEFKGMKKQKNWKSFLKVF